MSARYCSYKLLGSLVLMSSQATVAAQALPADNSPTSTAAQPASDGNSLEEVVVSGIRGSLRESLETKREAVAILEVHKSPEADLDEGSIGGLVNVRTRRPMELEPFTARASAEGQYSELPDEIDPQASGLISWRNSAGTFGALASISYQTRKMRRDGLEAFPDNALFDVTDQNGNVTQDVYSVWGGGSAIFQQDRQRITANATLQWRPTERWDVVLNYVDSDMDMDNRNQNYLFMPGGYKLPAGASVTNPVLVPTSDGRQALVGGTLEDPPISRRSRRSRWIRSRPV